MSAIVADIFANFIIFAKEDSGHSLYAAYFVTIFDIIKKFNYLNLKLHFSK